MIKKYVAFVKKLNKVLNKLLSIINNIANNVFKEVFRRWWQRYFKVIMFWMKASQRWMIKGYFSWSIPSDPLFYPFQTFWMDEFHMQKYIWSSAEKCLTWSSSWIWSNTKILFCNPFLAKWRTSQHPIIFLIHLFLSFSINIYI